MEHINRIELQGAVGTVRANEVNGHTVQNFSLYTQYISQRADGTCVGEGTWHNITAWDKVQVNKGDSVRVVGRVRQMKYTGTDGLDKIFNEVVASEVNIINE